MGVVEAFRQHAQIVEVSKAGGSSAGALVAAAMLTGLPMELVIVQVVEMQGCRICGSVVALLPGTFFYFARHFSLKGGTVVGGTATVAGDTDTLALSLKGSLF